uniref:Putative secreted peptide n=1 Tax=Anopheles braziliensis TaxID=58242 RepID=A0A2M3ZMP7_9DIPT
MVCVCVVFWLFCSLFQLFCFWLKISHLVGVYLLTLFTPPSPISISLLPALSLSFFLSASDRLYNTICFYLLY